MPDVDDFHPVVPAVTGSGVTTPEFASWLSNLVDEVRELRAAATDFETRVAANEAAVIDHEARVTVNEAAILDHEARITTLEP